MKRIAWIGLGVCMVIATGCYSSGSAKVKNQELVSQVELGKTTKEDVRSLFGEPNSVSRTSAQVASAGNPSEMVTVTEWWAYYHASSQADATTFIPYIGWLLGGTSYESEHLQVGFDPQGIVQHITSGSHKGRAGVLNSE